jgi:hypothetical protein
LQSRRSVKQKWAYRAGSQLALERISGHFSRAAVNTTAADSIAYDGEPMVKAGREFLSRTHHKAGR